MRLEDLGLIGNCQFSALVERTGAIVWCCLPRFDSEPVFSTLLDASDGGHFLVAPADGAPGSAALPRQHQRARDDVRDGRAARSGSSTSRRASSSTTAPSARRSSSASSSRSTARRASGCTASLASAGRSSEPLQVQGSNHVRFEGFPAQLRLTTDIPISYLSGQPFALTERRHLVLTWGAPVEEALAPLCERFLQETMRYWRRWVKECDVPPLFQQEVIRSALALKLHCFEDTGAIVAAMTTSIPEAPGSGRTWDYRYCWLRDAYYALSAFRLLGHFEEREQFVRYLINVASSTPDLDLAPLYRVDADVDLEERILEDWPGFDGEGPVRVGNAAARQRQNDVFGEMVLALSPVFLDDRFSAERSAATLELLERLARKAIAVAGTPDAGIWELRGSPKTQTFSSLMCWAAADRMANVAARHRPEREAGLRAAADRIRDEILAGAWNEKLGSFVAWHGGSDLDASLLQMASLRFLPAGRPAPAAHRRRRRGATSREAAG